jgi:hypothetical protein
MNAYELADEAKRQVELIYLVTDESIAKQLATMLDNYANMLRQQADRIVELEFENKAFRDELFKRGSMDSCSKAAAMHGFVSPRQAGDDAREYISGILEKAKNEQV